MVEPGRSPSRSSRQRPQHRRRHARKNQRCQGSDVPVLRKLVIGEGRTEYRRFVTSARWAKGKCSVRCVQGGSQEVSERLRRVPECRRSSIIAKPSARTLLTKRFP